MSFIEFIKSLHSQGYWSGNSGELHLFYTTDLLSFGPNIYESVCFKKMEEALHYSSILIQTFKTAFISITYNAIPT